MSTTHTFVAAPTPTGVGIFSASSAGEPAAAGYGHAVVGNAPGLAPAPGSGFVSPLYSEPRGVSAADPRHFLALEGQTAHRDAVSAILAWKNRSLTPTRTF